MKATDKAELNIVLKLKSTVWCPLYEQKQRNSIIFCRSFKFSFIEDLRIKEEHFSYKLSVSVDFSLNRRYREAP